LRALSATLQFSSLDIHSLFCNIFEPVSKHNQGVSTKYYYCYYLSTGYAIKYQIPILLLIEQNKTKTATIDPFALKVQPEISLLDTILFEESKPTTSDENGFLKPAQLDLT